MKVGRRNEFWKNNCVAIGVSAGFVEPLESTGLQLIDIGLRLFVDNFPSKLGDNLSLRAHYNKTMAKKFDDVKDFIVAHYCTSQRRDTPFWKDVTLNAKKSEQLDYYLKLWQERLPSFSDFGTDSIFGHYNYMYILAGQDKLINENMVNLLHIDINRSAKMLNAMSDIAKNAITMSPYHDEYLQRILAPFKLS